VGGATQDPAARKSGWSRADSRACDVGGVRTDLAATHIPGVCMLCRAGVRSAITLAPRLLLMR